MVAIFVFVILPIAAVKSCLDPDPTPTSSTSTYGTYSSYRGYPTSKAKPTPTYDPPATYDSTAAPEPADLPNVHIPNPNLPGHGPHVHLLPHIHIGGGRHHF